MTYWLRVYLEAVRLTKTFPRASADACYRLAKMTVDYLSAEEALAEMSSAQ